jgi:hypothetical protein
LAYHGRKLSTDIVAVISAFTIIPTETGVISGLSATYLAAVLLAAVFILLAVERKRAKELLFLQHRWRRWIKQHMIIFAFLFLMHMAFIYWFSRAFFGEPAPMNLPNEPPFDPIHWSTASFNLLVLPLGVIGMAERFRGTLRRTVTSTRLGYWWTLIIIIIGISLLGVASGAWWMAGPPLAVAIAILIISAWAYMSK